MHNNELQTIAVKTINLTQKNYNNAIAYLQTSLIKIQNDPALINNLGLLFYRGVEYNLACHCFYFLLEKHGDKHYCHNNLGLTLNRFGLGKKAVQHYKKALSIKSDYHQARSNLAYALQYYGETGRDEIKQAHIAIDKHVFGSPKSYLGSVDLDLNPSKKIVLGYVSSDFREHAVGRFLVGIFEQHNHEKFDIHVFDNRKNNNDGTAQHLKKFASHWHDIHSLNTDDACKLIQNSNVDVLIDLSGHTSGGRPDIFSNRIAPVQITYLGYPNTTGLSTMDFRIGDAFADRIEHADQNTESMLRLPFPMWNYTPWHDMPDVSASPFEKNKYVTFGSANNHAKLQTQWLEVWAKALSVLPNTHFKIKSRALKNPKTSEDLLTFFSDRGVRKDRITIEHYSPTKSAHWNFLNSFDIGLDSYPYNGTTTSCDLLWLGVPIISRTGNSHVSRTTASILNGVGLNDWVANTDNQFIQLCEEKSSDLFSLNHCRQNLRTRMQHESIGNSAIFIVEYEKLIQTVWRETCLKLSTD